MSEATPEPKEHCEPELEQIYVLNSAAEPSKEDLDKAEVPGEHNQDHDLGQYTTDRADSVVRNTPSPRAHHTLTMLKTHGTGTLILRPEPRSKTRPCSTPSHLTMQVEKSFIYSSHASHEYC